MLPSIWLCGRDKVLVVLSLKVSVPKEGVCNIDGVSTFIEVLRKINKKAKNAVTTDTSLEVKREKGFYARSDTGHKNVDLKAEMRLYKAHLVSTDG